MDLLPNVIQNQLFPYGHSRINISIGKRWHTLYESYSNGHTIINVFIEKRSNTFHHLLSLITYMDLTDIILHQIYPNVYTRINISIVKRSNTFILMFHLISNMELLKNRILHQLYPPDYQYGTVTEYHSISIVPSWLSIWSCYRILFNISYTLLITNVDLLQNIIQYQFHLNQRVRINISIGNRSNTFIFNLVGLFQELNLSKWYNMKWTWNE